MSKLERWFEHTNWAGTKTHHACYRLTPSETAMDRKPPEERVAQLDRAVSDLERALADAGRAGLHVRAVGSSWSFSDLLAPSDILVRTSAVAGLIATTASGTFLRSVLAPSATGDYAYVAAGTQLHTALAALWSEGLAVRTMGSASGQTLAGVSATGSHGADFDLAPIADDLVAIALVDGRGTRRWIESASQPVTASNDAVLALLPNVRPENIVRDDALLDAARVSLGALGVVVACVLRVRRRYGLLEHGHDTTFASIWDCLGDPARLFGAQPDPALVGPKTPGGRYRYLEILCSPYRDDVASGRARADGFLDRMVRVVTRYEHDEEGVQFSRPGALIESLQVLATLAPQSTYADYARVVPKLCRAGRGGTDGKVCRAHDVMDTGPQRSERVRSIEVVLEAAPEPAYRAFVERVLRDFDRLLDQGKRMAGFFSIRFSGASRALLAPEQGGGQRYAHIELFFLQRAERLDLAPGKGIGVRWYPHALAAANADFFAAVTKAVAETPGARVHWGQDASSDSVFRKSFDSLPQSSRTGWRRACETLCPGDAALRFANEWLLASGVIDGGRDLAVLPAIPTRNPNPKVEPDPAVATAPVLAMPEATTGARLFASDAYGAMAERALDGVWRPILDSEDENAKTQIEPDDVATAGRLAVATGADGKTHLFYRDRSGALRYRVRGKHEGDWRHGKVVGEAGNLASPPVATARHDALVVAAVGASKQLRVVTKGKGWSARDVLPGCVGVPALDLAFGVAVFAVRTATGIAVGDVEGRWQRTIAFAATRDPAVVGAPDVPGVLVAAASDDRVMVGWVDPTAPSPVVRDLVADVRAGTSLAAMRTSTGKAFVVGWTDSRGDVHLARITVDASGAPVIAAQRTLDSRATSGPTLVPRGGNVRVLARLSHRLIAAAEVPEGL